MAECNCETGLYNLQSGACIVHPGITRKYVFVEYFKADGSINGIDLSAAFGETQIDALLSNTDKALRGYLSDKVYNFVTERADPNTETIDNVNFITSQGTRAMSSDFLTSSAELANKINGNNCVDMGVYLIDEDNGWNGIVNRNDFLDPIKLERNSFGKVVFANETTKFKVSFSSTWGKSVKDGDLRTLTFAEHGTNVVDKRGLIDVNQSAAASASATNALITYKTVDGSANGSAFTGLVVGDFAMYNTTTSSAVVVSASVENPNGTYTLTFAAQVAAELGTINATKAGFEFASATITYQ
tara:strand:- start:5938 stop:6837 length:900 start_codon:yes stop_codon:yes gene_type:complete